MRVLLESVEREPEEGRVRLVVRIGAEPPKAFLAQLEAPHIGSTEPELFMRLSNLAAKRYCNCTIYQIELLGIVEAFLSGQQLPPFPIELGTTSFGMPRPTAIEIFWSRLTRPFVIAWFWWKFRHVRRENLLKYGSVAEAKV